MVEKSYLILTGENSGDIYAQLLIDEFETINGNINIFTISSNLKGHSVSCIVDNEIRNIMGITEVLSSLFKVRKLQKKIINFVKNNTLDGIIMVDFSGFNLSLSKRLSKINSNLIYFIPPKIWAWYSSRGKKVAKYFKVVIPIFKFEEKFFTKYNCNTFYAGHPLVDVAFENKKSKAEIFDKFDFIESNYTIGLFPGSRNQEIYKLFPVILESIMELRKTLPNVQLMLFLAQGIDKKYISKNIQNFDFNIKIIEKNEYFYDFLNVLDYAICTSGTVSFELALKSIPSVVIYKLSLISYIIGKLFFKAKYFGLPNIVANKMIMKELLQKEVTVDNIVSEIRNYFMNDDYQKLVNNNVSIIKQKVKGCNVSKQIAEYICSNF